MNVGGPARHLQFALDLRFARIGQVNNPQRVNPLISDDVNPLSVEARGEEAFALGQAQLAECLRLGRVGQAERLKRGQPAIAIFAGVAIEFLRDNRERVAAQAHLKFVRHAAGGANGGRLLHRAVRRGDVDAAQVGLVILLEHRRGDEQEFVGCINVVVVAAVEQRLALDWLGRVFQVERRDLRAVFPPERNNIRAWLGFLKLAINLRGNVEGRSHQSTLTNVTLDGDTGRNLQSVTRDIDNDGLALGIVAPPVATVAG